MTGRSKNTQTETQRLAEQFTQALRSLASVCTTVEEEGDALCETLKEADAGLGLQKDALTIYDIIKVQYQLITAWNQIENIRLEAKQSIQERKQQQLAIENEDEEEALHTLDFIQSEWAPSFQQQLESVKAKLKAAAKLHHSFIVKLAQAHTRSRLSAHIEDMLQVSIVREVFTAVAIAAGIAIVGVGALFASLFSPIFVVFAAVGFMLLIGGLFSLDSQAFIRRAQEGPILRYYLGTISRLARGGAFFNEHDLRHQDDHQSDETSSLILKTLGEPEPRMLPHETNPLPATLLPEEVAPIPAAVSKDGRLRVVPDSLYPPLPSDVEPSRPSSPCTHQ
jgi:hypothetical protein